MNTKILLIVLLLLTGIVSGQNKKHNSEDLKITPLIDGTLITPDSKKNLPLAILIGDSGPTDKNGNQQMMENNSLKLLAEGLYENKIASFRYDKRIVKQMKQRNIDEKNIRFNDFIDDAEAILKYFQNKKEFSKIYIIGHGQGSLVGMVAAQKGADGYISIAGAGQSIDDVIVDQLTQQAPGLADNARNSFDDLRVNGATYDFNPGLASIFRKEIQPFIGSWMAYNPSTEITKLDIPVLIINGTKDLQVQISEAELLRDAKPEATYHIIENMNHIFKKVEGNDLENSKTHNVYNLPVMPELIRVISGFIAE